MSTPYRIAAFKHRDRDSFATHLVLPTGYTLCGRRARRDQLAVYCRLLLPRRAVIHCANCCRVWDAAHPVRS